jgi:hypothetical protein
MTWSVGFACAQYYADFVGHPPMTDLRRGHRQKMIFLIVAAG